MSTVLNNQIEDSKTTTKIPIEEQKTEEISKIEKNVNDNKIIKSNILNEGSICLNENKDLQKELFDSSHVANKNSKYSLKSNKTNNSLNLKPSKPYIKSDLSILNEDTDNKNNDVETLKNISKKLQSIVTSKNKPNSKRSSIIKPKMICSKGIKKEIDNSKLIN